jgi:glycosyltransferase involved in cell wall biosynthesis
VVWAGRSTSSDHWKRDGVEFVTIGKIFRPLFSPWLQLIRLLAFCHRTDASCVYLDDWMFLRESPVQRLFFQVGLRVLGIACICDQRDPYIDFEIAQGRLEEGSWKHMKLAFIHRLSLDFTDLSVFPSKVYMEEMRNRGHSARNSIGVIRGVDIEQFRDRGEGSTVRARLGLEGKFIVGWFGMMLPYRSIDGIVLPMIEKAASRIPEAHFIVGGFGPMLQDFKTFKEKHPEANMTLLGYVPYEDMAMYLSACDVLLCTLNTAYKFTTNTTPLKILESVAVGRPVIATSINARYYDYKDIRGVVWTGTTCEDFLKCLEAVHKDYAQYREEAERQAENFEDFSTQSRVKEIVDGIEKCCRR